MILISDSDSQESRLILDSDSQELHIMHIDIREKHREDKFLNKIFLSKFKNSKIQIDS